MNAILGQKVHASKVFAWPDTVTMEDADKVHFAPVDNPLADAVAVVVGVSRRHYIGNVEPRSGGYDPEGNITEGVYVDMWPSTQTFIAIRYTLRWRRYFTTAEFLKEAMA